MCGISNALDGSRDDLVSNDVPFVESAEERECSDSELNMLRMMKMKKMLMELTLSVKTLTLTRLNLCDVYYKCTMQQFMFVVIFC